MLTRSASQIQCIECPLVIAQCLGGLKCEDTCEKTRENLSGSVGNMYRSGQRPPAMRGEYSYFLVCEAEIEGGLANIRLSGPLA